MTEQKREEKKRIDKNHGNLLNIFEIKTCELKLEHMTDVYAAKFRLKIERINKITKIIKKYHKKVLGISIERVHSIERNISGSSCVVVCCLFCSLHASYALNRSTKIH